MSTGPPSACGEVDAPPHPHLVDELAGRIPPERDRGELGLVTRLAERDDQAVRMGLGATRHERRLWVADQDPHAAFLATSAKS